MEIIDLEEVKKPSLKLYNKVEEKINEFGEVTTTTNSFVERVNTKDDFIKLFAMNISLLVADVSNTALKVFMMIIRNINFQNIFKYDTDFVSWFVDNNILGRSSVYNSISELEKKKIILKVSDEMKKEMSLIGSKLYYINPQIAGKGSIKDLRELRQTVTKTYNFDTLEMKQEYSVETKYNDLERVLSNPADYDLVEVSEAVSSDGKAINREIVVEKKPELENKETNKIQVENQNKSAENIKSEDLEAMQLKIELLKEENRQIELRIKEKEEDIRQRELELKEKELKDRENSLF